MLERNPVVFILLKVASAIDKEEIRMEYGEECADKFSTMKLI